MSREINPFGLRMPAELKEYLEEEAARHGRSLNAEIIFRLEQTAAISRAAQLAIRGTPEEAARQTLLIGIQSAKEMAETLQAGLDIMSRPKSGEKKRR